MHAAKGHKSTGYWPVLLIDKFGPFLDGHTAKVNAVV